MSNHSIDFLIQLKNLVIVQASALIMIRRRYFFLGNQLPKHLNDETEIRKAKVKRAVKILGVHFTYDVALSQKLNFDEVVEVEKPHCYRQNSNC